MYFNKLSFEILEKKNLKNTILNKKIIIIEIKYRKFILTKINNCYKKNDKLIIK
jgi:hypothetical protein